MNKDLYPFIFKRKSFHLFRGVGDDHITQEELSDIEKAYESFERLYPDISTKIRIVEAKKVNFKRDAEYCVMIYSEKKDNYLMNAGYIGQQLDLYCVGKDIGTLWFGIGKPDEPQYEGLDYVIMIALHKVKDQSLYRKDMFAAKRKSVEEIWKGDDLEIANIVRFSPSACNSQPWFVENDGNTLSVSRYKEERKIGIMTPKTAAYFNRIDIGIFLCILELCLINKGIGFSKNIFLDEKDKGYSLVAKYQLEK